MWNFVGNPIHSSAISAIASLVQAFAAVLSLGAVIWLSNVSNKIMNSQKELANKQYEESKNDYNMMQKKVAARLAKRFEAISSYLDGVANHSNPYFLALNGIDKGLEDEIIIRYLEVEITDEIFSVFERLGIYFTSFMKFYEQNHPDHEFGPNFGAKVGEYRLELIALVNELYKVSEILASDL